MAEKRQKRNGQHSRKHKLQRKIFLIGVTSFVCGVILGKIVFANEESVTTVTEERVNINQGRVQNPEEPKNRVKLERSFAEYTAWELVLVNRTHFMESGYVPELSEVEDHYWVDSRIAEDLQQMLADGRAEGMDFKICSAYRTEKKQTELYDDKVQRLMKEKGISYEKAYTEAGETVAYPGTSEHQLGLAVDIVAADYQILDDRQAETAEAEWLKAHCQEYGFILRYPLDKTEETGIIFEPWHYRYVGKEAAKAIMEQGICLEEYLEN